MNQDSDMSMIAAVEHPPPLKPLRVMAALVLLALGVCILEIAMTSNSAANRDFICYWAAGQQLVHHGNPYDGKAILQLERIAGFVDDRPFFMRNPPLAFFLTLPLGFMGERTGAIVWSLAIIAALMASIRMIWIMHGRPPDRLHLVGYCFPPALACLFQGQLGIFMLFTVVSFLYVHKSRPYLAGAALFLCALKPHLFLPFTVVLLAWIVVSKSYRILVGTSSALVASIVLAFFLDPAGWTHYTYMVRHADIQNEFIPTVSLIFRLIIDRRSLWLQFLPAFAGCVWGLWYFWKNREKWNWMDHGSLLLLVSLVVAPYAWVTDEAILLPAILAGLYRASDAGRSLLPFGCIAAAALVEVIAGVHANSGFYVWTAPAWLAWYLFAIHGTSLEAGSKQTAKPAMNTSLGSAAYLISRKQSNSVNEA